MTPGSPWWCSGTEVGGWGGFGRVCEGGRALGVCVRVCKGVGVLMFLRDAVAGKAGYVFLCCNELDARQGPLAKVSQLSGRCLGSAAA